MQGGGVRSAWCPRWTPGARTGLGELTGAPFQATVPPKGSLVPLPTLSHIPRSVSQPRAALTGILVTGTVCPWALTRQGPGAGGTGPSLEGQSSEVFVHGIGGAPWPGSQAVPGVDRGLGTGMR